MPRFAANLSMMFNEVPFLDRFKAASAAGFTAVEFLFPYEYSPEEVAAKAKAAGTQVVLFNMPAGNWGAGERGITALPGREQEFRDGVDKAPSMQNTWGLPGFTPWPASLLLEQTLLLAAPRSSQILSTQRKSSQRKTSRCFLKQSTRGTCLALLFPRKKTLMRSAKPWVRPT